MINAPKSRRKIYYIDGLPFIKSHLYQSKATEVACIFKFGRDWTNRRVLLIITPSLPRFKKFVIKI
ncbi:MAG: hypothetical protein WB511_07835 [Nitrososphaeraceae archaeon]